MVVFACVNVLRIQTKKFEGRFSLLYCLALILGEVTVAHR